jgi:hypothetical protein
LIPKIESNSDAIIEPKGESQDRGGHQYRGHQNHGPEFYRVEVERLGLSVRPLGRLAQNEERRCASSEAWSRRGLGQRTTAMKKMLLASAAALLLATGTAHADNEKWEASFRQCHIRKWFSKDELAEIGWAHETEGQTIVIEAEEIPDILKAIAVIKKCKAFYQCLENRDRGKVKHCYENDRRWRWL